MSDDPIPHRPGAALEGEPKERRTAPLVPRLGGGGYEPEQVAERRRWAEEETGARLAHVGGEPLPTRELRGNVENPIGAAQVPIGIAGPLAVEGEHARGTFYVPLATTEGALVRSYERGMAALTRAGGATARVERDENRVSPVFTLPDVAAASEFARSLPPRTAELARVAGSTTRHGKLLAVLPHVLGRRVMVELRFATGDAHGMNMVVRAAEEVCRLLAEESGAPYLMFSGQSSEKKASAGLLAGGKGKTVVAGARLPRRVVTAYLRTTPEALADLWAQTVSGHLAAGTVGYNGHFANGLTALFIACGQDVANVANSAVGVSVFEVIDGEDLYASVTLPALTVATVGGGTGLGSGAECLAMLGCLGAGKARKLAEIAAATLLAGELSFGAALASGQFVAAHESYGRNRPGEPGGAGRPDPGDGPSADRAGGAGEGGA